jgi:hypothetical protein
VQGRCITEQLVLPEKGSVPPIVRDQAREPEAKFRICVARIREMAGGEGDVRIFPGAPLPRRVIADGGIQELKWITALEATNNYPGGSWEDRGFNWFAGV